MHLLDRLDLSPPEGFAFEPRMKRQSDRVNDNWVKRYSELRLGRDFDLVPAKYQ
jgi:LPS sulfotransferase NodH